MAAPWRIPVFFVGQHNQVLPLPGHFTIRVLLISTTTKFCETQVESPGKRIVGVALHCQLFVFAEHRSENRLVGRCPGTPKEDVLCAAMC